MPPSKSEYEVERIVSDKYLVGRRFFFVQWRGFDSTHNTWEPEENLANCPRIVREYFGGKGLSNTQSKNISSTLMRSMKVSKTRRSSILALTSVKASPSGSRRSSVDSQAAKADDLKFAKVDDLQLPKIGELQSAEVSNLQSAEADDLQAATGTDLQPATANDLQSDAANDLQSDTANNLQSDTPNDLQNASANNLQPAIAINMQPAEATVCYISPNGPETEPSAEMDATPSLLPQKSVDQKIDLGSSKLGSSEEPHYESSRAEKLLSSMGLNLMVPQIKLVRINDDASYQSFCEVDIKKAGLRQLRFPRPSVHSTIAREKGGKGTRSPRPYSSSKRSRCSRDEKPILRHRFSVVDLTTDLLSSADETGFSSSQLPSDNDCSWRNSTSVEQKFPNKLQVRLFDQTPRPEVLTSVTFLENFESDAEPTSDCVTEDSDKENARKRGRSKRGRGRTCKENPRRPYKKSPGRPRKKSPGQAVAENPRTSVCGRIVKASRTRKSEMLAAAEVPAKDLPKTEDAMVLLTEKNCVGGSNFVMYFPRLKVIKSVPQKMADRYYSQAVIDYYRQSMQPHVKVARRSF